ncbi:MAG: glycosyltransferase family 2 protein [Verrucomicrobia bacterium]|nr:glycosyltransferase family 2 protein [Verrucomicrobiota bacterium]
MKIFKWSLLLIAVLALGHFGPKAWKARVQKPPVEIAWEVKEQKSFVIITPSYNNAKWCEKNLRSILDQNYDHYRVIYIDDASTDGTYEKVEKIIHESGQAHRFTLLHNERNQGAAANLYKAIHMCQDHEIAVLVDGDDQLAHEDVLNKLNSTYANPDVWVTYGSYVEYPSYKKGGWAKPIPASVLEKNEARKHKWGASHLKTFYVSLFKQIYVQDLLYEGRFLESSSDVAIMLPLIEMAGTHAHFVKDVLYVYNHLNPLNDDKLRWQKQFDMVSYIRSLPSYQPIEELPQEEYHREGADLLVFSYNRPLQLYAFLESVQTYVKGLEEVVVLYRADPAFADAYEKVKVAFPQVRFCAQGSNPASDFKPLTLELIQRGSSPYILMAVDDIVVKDAVDIQECTDALKKTHGYAFFLRLGKTIDYCYMQNKSEDIPPSIELQSNVYAWQFKMGQKDWRYLHNIDMTIYRKEDILPRLHKLEFTHPTSLESKWALKGNKNMVGLYFDASKIVNVPLNVVQNAEANRHMQSYTPEELLKKFESGLKIDIKPFHQISNHSLHIESEITFVPRS